MAKSYRNGKGSLSSVILGLVIVLLFLGLVSLSAWQRRAIPTFDEERRQTRLKNLADLYADNDKVLNHYHWIDRQKGIVGIPIERAKQMIIADLEANKPHPAELINPPVPPPAPNSSPAPVANPSASPSPASGVPPANPAPGAAAPPAPIVNPQSAPAPALNPAPPASNGSPAATPASNPGE
ncbi:MAG: hypothetical protein JOY92_04230 [Verrucomicrobia bacterium]|nr:hypothetical protein [Verrucomicrobiota bacterium]